MLEYRIDVREITEVIGGSVHVDSAFELDEFVVGDERFVPRGPIRFDVTVSNAGEALVSLGTVTADVTATCSRCLCEFPTEIVGDVEGYWLRPGDEVPEDTDVTGTVDSEFRIDLGPALMAALVVEAPFKPLHDQDCAGLCPTCGADLNEGDCGCGSVSAQDGPFSALKGLLDDDVRESDR